MVFQEPIGECFYFQASLHDKMFEETIDLGILNISEPKLYIVPTFPERSGKQMRFHHVISGF